MKTNRQIHEEAAGMNLEKSFFTRNNIDPEEIPKTDWISKEEFDKRLIEILNNVDGNEIITIPGIYDILAIYYNYNINEAYKEDIFVREKETEETD